MIFGKVYEQIKIKKKISHKNGFTIVELIVAVALLLIVLDVGYMFFSYGVNTYKRGENQSIVQTDIRMACGYITREMRNCTKAEVSFDSTSTPAAGYYYAIYNSVDKTFKFYNGTTQVYSTGQCINYFKYTVKAINGKYVLEFELSGTEGDRTYTTPSKVLLVNLKMPPTGITAETAYTIQDTSTSTTKFVMFKFLKP